MGKNLWSLFLLCLALWALLFFSGCPKNQAGILNQPGKSEAIKKKMERLEIQYEILAKDEPPQLATLPFRQKMAAAEKALEEGNYKEADSILSEAEEIISSLRQEYYQKHMTRVSAGQTKETPEQLLAQARLFQDKARLAENKKDQWAKEQYLAAAFEEMELALMLTRAKKEEPEKLLETAKEVATSYEAAGKGEKALAVKKNAVSWIADLLSAIDKQIQECITGESESCKRETLEENPKAFQQAYQKISELQKERSRLTEETKKYFPDAVLPTSPNQQQIETWAKQWREYYANKDRRPEPPKHTPEFKQEQKLLELLAEHNKLKEGAVPIQGTGIVIKIKEISVLGESVVMSGSISNYSTEPIYRPRITVCGRVAGEIVDLGYDRFNPQMSTTFQIKLTSLTAEAFTKRGLPYYEILLICEDAEGNVKKYLKPMG